MNAVVVSVTPPVLNKDGTWTDGSYEFYSLTALKGNWVAVCRLMYVNGAGQQATAIGNTKFVLP